MLDLEIRDQLQHYLKGEQSLAQFRDWFEPTTWNVEKLGDPVARELVYAVMLRVAEHSNGDWTEGELREHLRPLATAEPRPTRRSARAAARQ